MTSLTLCFENNQERFTDAFREDMDFIILTFLCKIRLIRFLTMSGNLTSTNEFLFNFKVIYFIYFFIFSNSELLIAFRLQFLDDYSFICTTITTGGSLSRPWTCDVTRLVPKSIHLRIATDNHCPQVFGTSGLEAPRTRILRNWNYSWFLDSIRRLSASSYYQIDKSCAL